MCLCVTRLTPPSTPPQWSMHHTCRLLDLLLNTCSVAIMADAAHMLSDVAGLGVSLFAAWAVSRRSHISYRCGGTC